MSATVDGRLIYSDDYILPLNDMLQVVHESLYGPRDRRRNETAQQSVHPTVRQLNLRLPELERRADRVLAFYQGNDHQNFAHGTRYERSGADFRRFGHIRNGARRGGCDPATRPGEPPIVISAL